MAFKNKTREREYKKQWQIENKQRLSALQRIWLANNAEKRKAVTRRYREKHKEEISSYNRQQYLSNKELFKMRQRRWEKENRATVNAKRRRYVQNHKEEVALKAQCYRDFVKEAAIHIYTNGEGTCRWCGQGDMDVLCLDHLEDGGNRHRKNNGKWIGNMYKWAMAHDYPPMFQVLCYNCNIKRKMLRTRKIQYEFKSTS